MDQIEFCGTCGREFHGGDTCFYCGVAQTSTGNTVTTPTLGNIVPTCYVCGREIDQYGGGQWCDGCENAEMKRRMGVY